MNGFFKKTVVALFMLPIVFLYAFSTNSVSAERGTHIVEKNFETDIVVPGFGSSPFFPVTLKATVPSAVKPGEEFYLTNLSYTVNEVTEYFAGCPAKQFFRIESFEVSSENETKTNMIRDFDDPIVMVEIEDCTAGYAAPLLAGEVDIGPFTAGQEGSVIIKSTEIGFEIGLEGPDGDPIFNLPVSYSLKPSDENLTIATIPIDSEAPVITLNGDSPMVVKQGDPYVEPGAKAVDNIDGDVSEQIEVSGDVDTSKIGAYKVTYTVSDSVGNEATAERIVNVVEAYGSWYTGEGPPSADLGSNGDSYLDLRTGDVYKRDPNAWNKVGNLKGDNGKQGSSILTGSGAPKANLGDVGDLYLDTNTGDVYEKAEDGWKKIANLQGPAGPQGPKGSAGSGGGSGAGGDDGGGKGKGKSPSGSDKDEKGKSAQGGKLPKTATSLPAFILFGTLLAVAGSVLFLRRRKAIE